MSKNSPLLVRYLPLHNYHIAPLSDITPEALLEATERLLSEFKGSEDIERNTILHFLVKKLGVNGGFGDYKIEFEKLQQFMKAHGLQKRYDLISPRHDLPIVHLKPREVSERLFLSGRPLPGRIFTGYDVDWGAINDRWYMRNPWQDYPGSHAECLPYDAVAEKWKSTKDGGESYLEAAMERCRMRIGMTLAHLLGDLLVSDDAQETDIPLIVPKIYRQGSMSETDFHKDEENCREVARIFRAWITQLDEGWVQVLPYNTSLIFLKGRFGEYDFLVRSFRDELFVEDEFYPHLLNRDMPRPNATLSFRRWFYFRYEGWLERDCHEAEIRFYAEGGSPENYPGPDQILEKHLAKTKAFVASAPQAEGFHTVGINDVEFCVSNLITIREFREFMHSEPRYAEYSRRAKGVDCWETINADEDESLPASVTWFDAMAYASWVSKTKALPARLLSEAEYAELAQSVFSPSTIRSADFFNMEHRRICRFYTPDGMPIDGHPPYMQEEDFQALYFRFIPEALDWKNSPDGLRFLVSQHFGEWLSLEGAAVNTLTLKCLCCLNASPNRGRVSPKSTGKYKSKKIGFRLCYRCEK